MVQLYRKKKIEIVVEAARARAVIEMIEDAGAKGYTVVPQVSGKGNRGIRDGRVAGAGRGRIVGPATRGGGIEDAGESLRLDVVVRDGDMSAASLPRTPGRIKQSSPSVLA